MREAYRKLGLLGWVSAFALVAGVLLQRFSRLPARYTWFEPLRTLRLVYEIEWFPSAVLAAFVAGAVRRAKVDGDAIEVVASGRTACLAIVLACGDAVVFPRHNGIDVASVVALVVLIARRSHAPGEYRQLIGHGVFAIGIFTSVSYCYTVLKAMAFVDRVPLDSWLVSVEKAVVGVELYKIVAAYASTRSAFVSLCDIVYFRFFQHMALTTVLLFGMRQRKERFEYLGALAFCYVLGGPLYHVLPAVGPSYYDPDAYSFLARLPLVTNGIRAWLYDNTQAVLAGEAEVLRTWGYIACMPSLHVAHELVMLYYARRSMPALAISSVFTSITMVAVVVLGWHYAIDAVGALLVASLAIALARWQRDSLMPAALTPLNDVELVPRRSLREWLAVLRRPLALPALPAVGRAHVMFAIGAFVIRFVIAFSSLEQVDRRFVPDDAYYTLSIARSLAHGLGPTADGTTLTNGFQPLLAFLTVPAFWLFSGTTAPFVCVLVVSAMADAVSVWLLGRLAARQGGPIAGIVAAAAWSLSPIAIANSLNGLETALAFACQLGFVEAWTRAEKRGRGYMLAGGLGGLALLARIDSVFVVVALGAITIARRRRSPRVIGQMVGAGVLVVAPWWLYSIFRLGRVVPESGAAVHAGIAIHESLYLTPLKAIAWLGGSLLGGAIVDLPQARLYLIQHPLLGAVLTILVLAAGVLLAWRWARNPIMLALMFHACALMLLYTLWLPALWFFRRYLEPVYGVVTLVGAVAAARALDPKPQEQWRRLVGASAIVLALGFGCGGGGRVLRGWGIEDERGLNGAKGYAAAARDVLALLPDGAVVGAFQSGALSYFTRPGVHVVNLDGVVDGRARKALEARRVLDYAAEREITHIADWRFNIESLRLLSSESRHGIEAHAVGQARWQGDDRFAVYAVALPVAR